MTVGARCPYCQSHSDLDDPVRCPGCGAIGHRDCWQENGGCAVPGCPQAAMAASPPLPPSSPPGWLPDPQGSGRQRWWTGAAWTDHLHPPLGS